MDSKLASRVFEGQQGAEQEFLKRFETRVFCLCLARLGEKQRAQRWTTALLAELLSQLRPAACKRDRALAEMDDIALARWAASHARERVSAANVSGDPAPSALPVFNMGAFLQGPAFHRIALDGMQTTDKRLLYRSLVQRMNPEEIGAELRMDPVGVPESAIAAAERALMVMRRERSKAQQRVEPIGKPKASASTDTTGET